MRTALKSFNLWLVRSSDTLNPARSCWLCRWVDGKKRKSQLIFLPSFCLHGDSLLWWFIPSWTATAQLFWGKAASGAAAVRRMMRRRRICWHKAPFIWHYEDVGKWELLISKVFHVFSEKSSLSSSSLKKCCAFSGPAYVLYPFKFDWYKWVSAVGNLTTI